MDKSLDQTKKIKLNVSNIHSILIKGNKDQKKINLRKERLSAKQKSKEKFKEKEKKLESPIKSSLNKVNESVGSPTGGSIFDKLLEFLGLTLLGIIVNAAPIIIKKVKEVFDIVVEVFTPIQSTFNLIVGFMTGEIDDPKYDADKKRVDGVIEKLNKPGGKADKLISKTGLLEPYIRKFTKALNMGSKGVVLAKQGGMEGFKDTKTGKFTKRQWTTSERKSYESSKITKVSDGEIETLPESSGETPINSNDPSVRLDDHHPRSQAASPGGSGKPFEAGTRYKNGKIFLHWTAGTYTSTYGTYHTIFTGDGKAHRKASYDTFRNGHTWGRNDEGVALSIAALGDKTSQGRWPNEDDHGKYPIKSVQIQSMAEEIARLAIAWDWKKSDIKLGRVYTHAEIAREESPPYGPGSKDPQTKWDLWNLKSGGPVWSGGKIIRNLAKKYYDKMKSTVATGEGGSINMFTQARPDERKMAAINQPMYEDLDDEEEIINVYIQPINNKRTVYNYQPIPV
jgi:hypothetical protein